MKDKIRRFIFKKLFSDIYNDLWFYLDPGTDCARKLYIQMNRGECSPRYEFERFVNCDGNLYKKIKETLFGKRKA
jgi:hypothetical protein